MNEQRRLAALAKAADLVSFTSGSKCPECGSRSVEDNGSTEYRCVECDHRWGVDMGERYGF